MFRIKSESSVASGVRRIEATTGRVSIDETRHGRNTLLKAAQFFKTAPGTILERMEQQANEMKELRQTLEKFKAEASLGEARQVMASAKTGPRHQGRRSGQVRIRCVRRQGRRQTRQRHGRRHRPFEGGRCTGHRG